MFKSICNTKLLYLGIAAGIIVIVTYSTAQARVPDFEFYPAGSERKAAFFYYFSPLVIEANQQVLVARRKLEQTKGVANSLSWWQKRTVKSLASDYGINEFNFASDDDWKQLLLRVDIVPASLALSQAANESGWGTSRFAKQGHNYFGQWCFVKGCGLQPLARDGGKTHEVAVFSSPRDSVERYIYNINTNEAYSALRAERAALREQGKPISGLALVGGLSRYSERGDDYVSELRAMIRGNKLERYDAGQ